MARSISLRRPLTLIATAAAAAVAASLVVAPAAMASTTTASNAVTAQAATVEEGTLSWGVSERWRSYITGNIAKGQVSAVAPAALNDDNTVTWVEGSGEVDLAAGTGSITYRGGMTSQGHHGLGPGGGYALDQTLSDARIDLTSTTTATLSAVVDQPGASGFPEYRDERVGLAALSFEEGDLMDGQVVASAVFTEEGADVYARTNEDFQPGARLDDVVFGIGVDAGEPEPQTPTSVSLTVSQQTVCSGAALTFQTGVSPAIPGVVTLWDGDSRIGDEVTTNNGATTIETTRLAIGDHALTARFAPADSGYAKSTSPRKTVSVVDCAPDESKVEGSLQWGVKESFRNYVVGSIAHGEIATSKGAKQARGNGVFTFPQAASGSRWDGTTGTVQYAGQVTFTGHDGIMDVTLANPLIRVTSASSAELRIPFGGDGKHITFAKIDLTSGITQHLGDDSARFRGARTTLTSAGAQFFSYEGSAFYEAGVELDRITFTVGAASDVETAAPPKPSNAANDRAPAAKSPAPTARPADSGAAGSLTWGVSNAFAAYTTCEGKERFGYGHCAKGSISTSGVGSGYLFPQSTGGDWDAESQTGTVRYSGVVSFHGYGMTMFSVSNPSITVDGPASATLHTGNTSGFGSVSYRLDLSSAAKSEGDDGEVTWTGVGVDGVLTGGPGGGSSNSIGFDDLTFTVGTPGTSAFGDTEESETDAEYSPEETAPTTTGIELLTPDDRIRQGGRIQLQAPGFDADDSGILVVLYGDDDGSEPIVLDDEASADADGLVRWAGTLPDEGVGDHVITLQGSTDAGAAIEILERESHETAGTVVTAPGTEQATAAGAAALPAPAAGGMAPWEWWVIAVSLTAIAGCMSVLAARQRRALA